MLPISNGMKKKKKNNEVSNGDLAKQIEAVSRELSMQIETVALAVAGAQNGIAEVNQRIIGVDSKIDGINRRIDDLAFNRAKTDEVNARFLRLEKKVGLSKH